MYTYPSNIQTQTYQPTLTKCPSCGYCLACGRPENILGNCDKSILNTNLSNGTTQAGTINTI